MRTSALIMAAALVVAVASFAVAQSQCPPQSVHTFAGAGETNFHVESGSLSFGVGSVTVYETNTADCNGDGQGADFDGDFDFGNGGGFLPGGPWAGTCDNGLVAHHGTLVQVVDAVFGGVTFYTAADDMDGPLLISDPTSGSVQCVTDGTISPATDPDDCVSVLYVGSGVACGYGGDGGYWVVLVCGASVAGAVTVTNCPTTGTIVTF